MHFSPKCVCQSLFSLRLPTIPEWLFQLCVCVCVHAHEYVSVCLGLSRLALKRIAEVMVLG